MKKMPINYCRLKSSILIMVEELLISGRSRYKKTIPTPAKNGVSISQDHTPSSGSKDDRFLKFEKILSN